MSKMVQYNPTDPDVAGRVTLHRLIFDTPQTTPPNMLINPDLTGLFEPVTRVYTVPLKYWKESSGSVVEMSAGEKTAVDAVELANEKTAKKLAIDSKTKQLIVQAGVTGNGPGNALKAQINAANTIDEVNAVTDNR